VPGHTTDNHASSCADSSYLPITLSETKETSLDYHGNGILGVISREEGVALAKAAERCPQCILYGVRPPLF
jgi:hypothetical protein